ncbi:MAG: co-chaperone DjlA [Halofilum sp. (in: g-proteobacteria)]
MSFPVIIGGLIGLFVGGFPGLLLGAAIGYAVGQLLRRSLLGRVTAVRGQFVESTFAVMGAMCKADGLVTGNEIRAAEQVFDRLHLRGEQRDIAKAAFNRGKADDFDLDAEIAVLKQAVHGQRALLQVFLQVQLWAIAADGVLHEEERELLLHVARGLDLPDAEVQRLEAMLHGGAGAAADSGQSLEEAYDILGVDASASDAEVKKAYRRLMSQHHPDKLASRGLPESMREVAEQRTHEIRKAYERVTEARQKA